jgi:oxygen-independent coproporphyrinogen-3 oxidase
LSGPRHGAAPELGLYVHIPFCAARCPYCDFATAPARSPLRARYFSALSGEIETQGRVLGRPRIATLYFGGGTPSLMEAVEFGGVMRALDDAFELRLAEATLEANPGTVSRDSLAVFVAGGITRVSLGAQSLDPSGLRALARTHSVSDVERAVADARAAGVRDLNLDLIYGWPGQSREAWRADLARALALRPDHVSCYPLALEAEPEEAVENWPGGGWPVLARWRGSAQRAQPDDDTLALMYADAERLLARGGLRQYEISNWARPGHRCRHNLIYWRDGEWLGVGLGAHSHIAGRRIWNSARIQQYLDRWSRSDRSQEWRAADAGETAILALRLREGLRFTDFERRYGHAATLSLTARLREFDGSGTIRWRRDGIALTRRGRLVSNEVFARLLPDPRSDESSCA